MVQTRSRSKTKPDSNVGATRGVAEASNKNAMTKKRKKTATNFTVKVIKASRRTTKKANSTKNAQTSQNSYSVLKKLIAVDLNEFHLVQDHYTEMCAREYRAKNDGKRPSREYLNEKQLEFLQMNSKQQLEVRKKYRAEEKERKEEIKKAFYTLD